VRRSAPKLEDATTARPPAASAVRQLSECRRPGITKDSQRRREGPHVRKRALKVRLTSRFRPSLDGAIERNCGCFARPRCKGAMSGKSGSARGDAR
jgi:hypothetical protein